jgi:hypothetical protein
MVSRVQCFVYAPSLGFMFFSSFYFSLSLAAAGSAGVIWFRLPPGGALTSGGLTVACCPLGTPYVSNHMVGAGAAGALELPKGWAGLNKMIVET